MTDRKFNIMCCPYRVMPKFNVDIRDNSDGHKVDYKLLKKAIEWYLDENWNSIYRKPRTVRYISNCANYAQLVLYYRRFYVHELLLLYENKGNIPKGMVTHHLNGNGRDNRLENLTLITLQEHSSLHTKGRKISEAHKKAISDATRGKPRPPEVRKKISESHKGKKCSEETKEKLRQINLGKTYDRTEEHREIYRKATKKAWAEGRMKGMTGKHFSEETKRKMSNSAKNRKKNKDRR